MVMWRVVERDSFVVAGQRTWISDQDNSLFGSFWAQFREEGLLSELPRLRGSEPGACTGAAVMGVSCVDEDPADRAFWFWIAAELGPEAIAEARTLGLLVREVPACTWAVFDGGHTLPDSLVAAEMYAFGEWLPESGYVHAAAPELEVYLPTASGDCEFWLPVKLK